MAPAVKQAMLSHRRREKSADDKRLSKFARGDAISTKRLTDKKLKGKLRYSEKLVREATASAAQADEWLLPAEAGGLEAEGMERTWRFKQDAIAHGEQMPPAALEQNIRACVCDAQTAICRFQNAGSNQAPADVAADEGSSPSAPGDGRKRGKLMHFLATDSNLAA